MNSLLLLSLRLFSAASNISLAASVTMYASYQILQTSPIYSPFPNRDSYSALCRLILSSIYEASARVSIYLSTLESCIILNSDCLDGALTREKPSDDQISLPELEGMRAQDSCSSLHSSISLARVIGSIICLPSTSLTTTS